MSPKLLQLLTHSLILTVSCADIHIGEALNIFNYFGDLGSFFKVTPQYRTNWLLDQNSKEVFEEVLETRSPVLPTEDSLFNGDFHLELCDNLTQLKQAYFKSYKIERSEKPWRAFTGSWTNSITAWNFGLNSSYLLGQHSYVLVRITRNHELVKLTPHNGLRLTSRTAKWTGLVVPGQVNSVHKFIEASGSHYVNSYMTGDSLYQVFVFKPSVYNELQNVMRIYEAGSLGLDKVLDFFTPWHVESIGVIVSMSGNRSLEQWATQTLQNRVFMFIYSSLLKLHNSPELLQQLNYLLGNNALISVELKTLAPLLSDKDKRLWFEEVLDNHIKLWELNV